MQFNNVEHALSWAFQVSATPIVKTSSVHNMMGGGGRAFGELTPHDKHAMAAMILDMANRSMNKLELILVSALYGMPDPVEIRAQLVPFVVAGMPTGIHSRRAIEDVINAYCGRNRGVRELRRTLQCSQSNALEIRRAAYERMDALYHSAMDKFRAAIADELLRHVA